MRRKACRIQVDFDSQVQCNLNYFRTSKNSIKAEVLAFLDRLIYDGYRHFIIYIETPTDFWVAELLYFLMPYWKDIGVVYSLGFWNDDAGLDYAWLDQSRFFHYEVINSAYRIIWRQGDWLDMQFTLKRLDFYELFRNVL